MAGRIVSSEARGWARTEFLHRMGCPASAVIDSNGRARALALTQTAPGRYEAETYLDQTGAYFVRVAPVGEANAAAGPGETTVGYARPYSPEYAQMEGGEENLRDWALLGGGAMLEAPDQAFVLNAPVAAARIDLFPLLLALAALLLPFDVGVRRIAVNLRKLFGASDERLSPAGAPESRARVDQLLRVRTRVTDTPGAQIMPRRTAQSSASSQAAQRQDSSSQAAATAAELLRRRRQLAQTEADRE